MSSVEVRTLVDAFHELEAAAKSALVEFIRGRAILTGEAPDLCRHCLCEVTWEPGRGLVHRDGGVWFQRCTSCHWYGALAESVVVCPGCGRWTVRDDHRAALFDAGL